MPRTLLAVFKQWKSSAGVENIEVKETFHWIPDGARREYELARAALDAIPGSRDYLRTYSSPDKMPFMDSVGTKLLDEFGSHHSGSSAIALAYSYKKALNDWDGFVLDTKRHYAKLEYNKLQLDHDDIYNYKKLINSDAGEMAIDSEILSLKKEFSIQYDIAIVRAMLNDLIKEKDDEAVQAALNRLNI
jgi:hypothetical protein